MKKSSLLDIHCVNCLSPFTGIKDTSGQKCVHHPGFICKYLKSLKMMYMYNVPRTIEKGSAVG